MSLLQRWDLESLHFPIFEFIWPLLAHNLECSARVNRSKRQPFRPSHAQSPAPTSECTCENRGCPDPLFSLHGEECLVVAMTLFSPGTHISWPGHPWSELQGLGKSMLSQHEATGSFGAGQGADHMGARTQKSSCKRMELNTLSWLDDSVTCYLGGTIITLLPHLLWWPPLSWGWGGRVGDRCSKGSTLSKSMQFYFE